MTRFYTQARRPLFPHCPLRKRLLPMMTKVNGVLSWVCAKILIFFSPDDRLVRVMLQRWLQRICEDPILLQDEELRLFVESDFGVRSPISDLSSLLTLDSINRLFDRAVKSAAVSVW